MITRRTFVKAGGCALVAYAGAPRFLLRAAHAADASGKVLVAIFQRGAVDGLSMVTPYGDPGYTGVRPSIGLQPPRRGESERAADLDGFFAFHPSLAPLVPLWANRSLAVVHACGSPDTTRSHFDAQDYMESGTPGVKSTPDGWLARAVGARPAKSTPFRAVAIGPALPRTLQGDVGAISMQSLDRFDVRGGSDGTARAGFESLYEQGVHDLLHGTGRETFDAVRMLRSARASRIPPANGAEYPRVPLGEALRQIAQLIKANVGLEVAFADMQGWDTHVGQGASDGQLAGRLDDLARGIAALTHDLGDRMGDTVIMTMSEFGRAASQNGNGGTDHGHGNAMMLIGGPVKGGHVYGNWPGLRPEQRYESRDLAVTTDFRDVFSEVVTTHLGAERPSLSRIFPGYSPGAGLGILG